MLRVGWTGGVTSAGAVVSGSDDKSADGPAKFFTSSDKPMTDKSKSKKDGENKL